MRSGDRRQLNINQENTGDMRGCRWESTSWVTVQPGPARKEGTNLGEGPAGRGNSWCEGPRWFRAWGSEKRQLAHLQTWSERVGAGGRAEAPISPTGRGEIWRLPAREWSGRVRE